MPNKIIFFLLGLLWSVGVCAQDLPVANFASPVFHHSENNVCAHATGVSLDLEKRSVTISFPEQFLMIGQSGVRHRANCVVDLVFSHKLTKPETIWIDIRGAEAKEGPIRLKYVISLGDQDHHFVYEKGRIIESKDASQSDFLRRFELTDIPRGTKKIRISFHGTIKNYDKKSIGFLQLDSLDACFVDPADKSPTRCGGAPVPKSTKAQ
jgi:hypothetical protein